MPTPPNTRVTRPPLLNAGANVLRSTASAASSLWRTQVARQGRLNDEAYQARLATCRSCPSGHATFDANGNLKTCGSTLAGMASSDKTKTGCGCSLRAKARDAQQACPMGHWPTVRKTDLEPARRPERIALPGPARSAPSPALASSSPSTDENAGRLILPGNPAWPFNRRGFLRRAAAAGVAGSAATLLGERVVQAQGKSGCYVQIEACEDDSTHWLSCAKIQEGTTTQTVVKDASQDKCYTIVGAKAVSEAEAKKSGGDLLSFTPSKVDDCNACNPCDFCDFPQTVYMNADEAAITNDELNAGIPCEVADEGPGMNRWAGYVVVGQPAYCVYDLNHGWICGFRTSNNTGDDWAVYAKGGTCKDGPLGSYPTQITQGQVLHGEMSPISPTIANRNMSIS
ncbi:MAG: hypothetical protein AAGI54_03860 [Planctomycetota bacterium]